MNLYTYAENNPVTFADPQGRILPAVIAAGAAIGAITNGVIYAGTSLASGGFTWGGQFMSHCMLFQLCSG